MAAENRSGNTLSHSCRTIKKPTSNKNDNHNLNNYGQSSCQEAADQDS